MGLAFIPVYIKYLGVEAYGLIGIYATLQACLSILDMGMKPLMSREMARFSAGAHTPQSARDLLRTVETIAMALAAFIALAVASASGWLASSWLTTEKLPIAVAAQALAVMGVVVALRFIEDLYASCIAGLQRQVLENIVTASMATARGVGAIAILKWVSPTVTAFFLWQGLISVIGTALLARFVYQALPRAPQPARFSRGSLNEVWRFAGAMTAIVLLTVLLTQIDKILLSRLLTLEAFSYYALAGAVAGTLYMLAQPITSAFYPRFTELLARGEQTTLHAAYHQGAQLVAVCVGGAAIVVIVFADRMLLLWTADPALTQQVARLLPVLALGTLLNCLMVIPYYIQLAHGWTSLVLKVNLIAVAVLLPALWILVPKYGALGAAWVWVSLNATYLIAVGHLMHARLLPTEELRWYVQDTAAPLLAVAISAAAFRWMLPDTLGRGGALVALLAVSSAVLLIGALSAPMVRQQLISHLTRSGQAIIARR